MYIYKKIKKKKNTNTSHIESGLCNSADNSRKCAKNNDNKINI